MAANVEFGYAESVEPVRLLLCAIVRNEGRIIERCLRHALTIADGYVICDTGSIDGTSANIERVAAEMGVPGRILHHPFRDFGYNRTLAAQGARQWAMEQGWSLERSYLLLLDADMVLRIDESFDKHALCAGGYLIAQDDGVLRYYNTRLANLAYEWQAIGVTHEYWAPAGASVEQETLSNLWIEDRGDGANKAHKFTRDVALLRQGLMREPSNARYVFYLAQSYFDLGRYGEAATWYARRWALGGWEEERWYARYRQGLCLLRQGDGQRATGMLLEAFEERPHRAEPLKILSQYYREKGRNHTAMMFALRGLEIPFPWRDVLFVEKQVYEWQLWEELMINAYYTGGTHFEFGLSACERLLARRGHDQWFYNYVLSNELFYLDPAPRSSGGHFELSSTVREHEGIEYLPANPTVTRHNGEILVNVRLLNYRQAGGRSYEPFGHEAFLTRNVLFCFHPDGGLQSSLTELYGIPEEWPKDTRIRGLEDLRFTSHEGRVWFTAACNQVPGEANECRVVLGRLDESSSSVEWLIPLRYDRATNYEKNWLPWSRKGQLCVVYGYDPLVILAVDVETGECSVLQEIEPLFCARTFRGSASPIPIPGSDDRWLALVHEVAYRECGNVYSHRFIELTDEDGIVRYSRPFYFDETGIEYAAGMCAIDDEHLLLTYGHDDREARWLTLRWADVLGSLRASERGVLIAAHLSEP